MAEKEEVTVTVQAAGTVTADSGSEVSERNRINPSDSGKRRSQGNNFKMLNSDVSDQRLNVEAIIKNINKISLELKKINEISQLLLCGLTLYFHRPAKAGDFGGTERNKSLFEELTLPDFSLASNRFSP